MKLITTDAENAVWNCVAKQPPEEKPLTEMVLGLMRRLSRLSWLSWHRARGTSAKTRNSLVILLLLLSRTLIKQTNTNVVVQSILKISQMKRSKNISKIHDYTDDFNYPLYYHNVLHQHSSGAE